MKIKLMIRRFLNKTFPLSAAAIQDLTVFLGLTFLFVGCCLTFSAGVGLMVCGGILVFMGILPAIRG